VKMCILCGGGSALADALAPATLALAVALPLELAPRFKSMLQRRKACALKPEKP
jgi:hypothetical protein